MGQSQQFTSPPIERGAFHCQQVSQLHLHTALLALIKCGDVYHENIFKWYVVEKY